jgi:hypothetical protein
MMNENKGTYITSNTLLSISKYDNILRFDSDDIMVGNMVETLINNSNDCDVISMKYCNFYNNDKKTHNSSAFTQGVLFYKRKVLNKIIGYRPWLCAADAEFLLRIKKNNFKIKKLDKFLFNRRTHNKSLTKNEKTSWGSELRKSYIKEINNYSIMDLNNIEYEFVKNNYIEYE